jgi:hypothetical protein
MLLEESLLPTGLFALLRFVPLPPIPLFAFAIVVSPFRFLKIMLREFLKAF